MICCICYPKATICRPLLKPAYFMKNFIQQKARSNMCTYDFELFSLLDYIKNAAYLKG